MHWDEGWTLCSARYLAEIGHYGCFYNGNPTVIRLTTSWITIVMAAAGFLTFGAHYLAARALFVIATLLLIFTYTRLVRKLFGQIAEVICLALIITLSPFLESSPIFMGATSWGEVPSLLALSTGLTLLLTDRTGQPHTKLGRSLAALPFFTLASIAKVQMRTFITVALISAGLIALLNARTRRSGLILLGLGICTWCLYAVLPGAPWPVKTSLDMTGAWSSKLNLAPLLGLNLNPTNRLWALERLVPSSLHIIVFFACVVIRYFKKVSLQQDASFFTYLPLLTFAAFQLGWFLILAAPWPRYSMPGLFIATGPAAYWIAQWLKTYTAKFSRRRPPTPLLLLQFRYIPLLVVSLGLINLTCNLTALVRRSAGNKNLTATIEFINSKTASDSRIETYDTSLFAFIKRPFIYPPDEYHALFFMHQEQIASELTYPRASHFVVGEYTRAFQVDKNRLDGYSEEMRAGNFTVFKRQ